MDNKERMNVPLRSIELEKLRYYIQSVFDEYPAISQSLEVVYFDRLETMRGMAVRLSAQMLAEEVGRRTRVVCFEIEVPDTWWDSFKLAKFPAWLKRRYPVQYRTLTKKKKVTFRKLAAFPEANIIFPKEMGNKIVYKERIEEQNGKA